MRVHWRLYHHLDTRDPWFGVDIPPDRALLTAVWRKWEERWHRPGETDPILEYVAIQSGLTMLFNSDAADIGTREPTPAELRVIVAQRFGEDVAYRARRRNSNQLVKLTEMRPEIELGMAWARAVLLTKVRHRLPVWIAQEVPETSPDLLQIFRDSATDDGALGVVSDWLEERGFPRPEVNPEAFYDQGGIWENYVETPDTLGPFKVSTGHVVCRHGVPQTTCGECSRELAPSHPYARPSAYQNLVALAGRNLLPALYGTDLDPSAWRGTLHNPTGEPAVGRMVVPIQTPGRVGILPRPPMPAEERARIRQITANAFRNYRAQEDAPTTIQLPPPDHDAAYYDEDPEADLYGDLDNDLDDLDDDE